MLQPAIDGEVDVNTEMTVDGMEVGAVDRVVAVGCSSGGRQLPRGERRPILQLMIHDASKTYLF